MQHWLAVHCKPRQEMIAQENLLRQGYAVYLPRVQNSRRLRGQWIDVVVALFPRYLFIQIDPAISSIAPVRSTRGVVGLVNFGGQPTVIADAIIEGIRQRENAATGLHQQHRPIFNAGEYVKLVDGPLAGLDAVFAEEDGCARVNVLLELLGKTHKMNVKRDWVAQAA